jgi:lysophospholipase L1-like esterase
MTSRRRVRNWMMAVVVGAGTVATLGAATIGVPGVAGAATGSGAKSYYVSLGDSYSVGYQPGKGSTFGYTGYVAARTHLTLANFGCGGATTGSILDAVGCSADLSAKFGRISYPTTTQVGAAETFIHAHAGHIGLITVSIGGNDVTACASASNPISCVATAVTGINTNVTALAAALRNAAGPEVPIIGTTYPDVILGSYVYPSQPATATTIALAKESVVAFRSLINPALQKAYGSVLGRFVDVTMATGAYGSLTKTTKLKPYGTIPVPVAKVCTLTWFCAQGNIHAKTVGYNLIGKLIVGSYQAAKQS